MAFNFPEDKADFTAPNGVTYAWDGTKWVTKTFRADEAMLEGYATEQWTEEKIADAMLEGEVDLSTYATVDYSDTADQNLQNQIDELAVTKGSVARYEVKATHIGAASRNGELYVNEPQAADVQAISFAPLDLNGQPTKPCNVGDIVEFVEVVARGVDDPAVQSVGEVTRYKVLSGDYNAMTVEYLGGTNNFVAGEREEVYIYPQNTASVSKEYVDEQDALKLSLTGGTLTGALNIDKSSGQSITLKKDGTANLKLWADGSAETTKTTFADNNLVTKLYVDAKVAGVDIPDVSGYLPKSGGTMTGELNINRGAASTAIRLQENGTNRIKLWNSNGEARLEVFNGQVFKLTGYVDNQIKQLFGVSSTGTVTLSNLRTPSDASDAVTKAYCDSPRRPPGLRFLYTLDDPAPATKFRIYTSNGTKRMQISGTSRDFKWLGFNPGSDLRFDEGHRYTIYYNDGDNGWRVKKTGTYNKVDYHANDVVVHFSSELNSDPPLNPGAEYYIYLAGMF